MKMTVSRWMIVPVLLLGGCASPKFSEPVLPEAVSRPISRGQQAQAAGRVTEAANRYAEAMQAARALDDRVGAAMALYHLGVLRASGGDAKAALPLLEEALRTLDGREAPQAALRIARAEAMMALGLPEASRRAEEALAWAGREKDSGRTVQARLLVAKLDVDAGRLEPASEHLRVADAELKKSPNPRLRARHSFLVAELAAAEGRLDVASARFEAAAGDYRRAAHPAGVSRALLRAGRTWRQAGQPEKAADALLRSAFSFQAQSLPADARQAIEELLALPETEALRPLRAEAQALLSEMEAPSP